MITDVESGQSDLIFLVQRIIKKHEIYIHTKWKSNYEFVIII